MILIKTKKVSVDITQSKPEVEEYLKKEYVKIINTAIEKLLASYPKWFAKQIEAAQQEIIEKKKLEEAKRQEKALKQLTATQRRLYEERKARKEKWFFEHEHRERVPAAHWTEDWISQFNYNGPSYQDIADQIDSDFEDKICPPEWL